MIDQHGITKLVRQVQVVPKQPESPESDLKAGTVRPIVLQYFPCPLSFSITTISPFPLPVVFKPRRSIGRDQLDHLHARPARVDLFPRRDPSLPTLPWKEGRRKGDEEELGEPPRQQQQQSIRERL